VKEEFNRTGRISISGRDQIKAEPFKYETQLAELAAFFQGRAIPAGPIRLNAHTEIRDPALFISSHFGCVNGLKKGRAWMPYVRRLIALRDLIKANEK